MLRMTSSTFGFCLLIFIAFITHFKETYAHIQAHKHKHTSMISVEEKYALLGHYTLLGHRHLKLVVLTQLQTWT